MPGAHSSASARTGRTGPPARSGAWQNRRMPPSADLKPVTDAQLADLAAQALAAPRRRANLNLHPELADPVQRFLNALQPGTYVRPHRHAGEAARWELFVALAGAAAVLVFDDAGRVVEVVEVDAAGPVRALEIPPGVWHTLVVRRPDTVLFEFKPGPYAPTSDKDFAPWAPAEGDAAAPALAAALAAARVGDVPAPTAAPRGAKRAPRRKAPKWKPTPGVFALYVGPTKAATRRVRVLAEATGGWMFVEAVGQKGMNVRFSVKRTNLREPERDLFES